MKLKIIILIFPLLLSSLSPVHGESLKTPIKIGSKVFSEALLLGEMLALILENKFNQPVVRRLNLGGTKVVFDALQNDDIDIYAEYTGTGYVFILKEKNFVKNPEVIYEKVKKEYYERFKIIWGPPIGFNNSYVLAVRDDDPNFQNINSLSELPKDLTSYGFASAHEFMERTDGFNAFKNFYNLDFNMDEVIGMDSGLMYGALVNEQVDMIMAYGTDGRILAYDLKAIKDDQNFFPPYWAAWNFKEEALRKFPHLQKAVNLFHNLISEEEMRHMNAAVDEYKKSPKEVAKNFLIKKGILKGKITNSQAKRSLPLFIYKKRNYLLKVTKDHIKLSALSLLLAIIISLPIGIMLTRYEKMAGPVFAVINTVQTIPSLALLGLLIPITGIGFTPAIIALFLYSLLPLIRNTYTGIHGVDKNYIEASKGMGLTSYQILKSVEIPLAMPVILAGIRTSSVIVIGTATLAALVGAGGLGEPIFRGVATINSQLIILGAAPSALLTITVDKLLGLAETKLISKGLQLMNKR